MELEDFWALIHRSSTAAKSQRERTEWLTGHLARLPVPAIIEFELHLTAQRKRVDTWLMWGAAWIIMQGWCSDDGFFYFQPWLVGLGHETFERVAGNPGSLADTPQIRRLAGSHFWRPPQEPEGRGEPCGPAIWPEARPGFLSSDTLLASAPATPWSLPSS